MAKTAVVAPKSKRGRAAGKRKRKSNDKKKKNELERVLQAAEKGDLYEVLGVKRDASQMMTVEERDERVRKIVSLVKVLLTGACGRDIARVSTRDTRPSPIAQAAAFGPRTVVC